MKTHIVIPIGVGSPGTPVQRYLEESVNSILNQTSKDFILTVAADSNIPDRCKDFLDSKGIKIKWFETFSYFRKGGIWKKIFDTWKEEDSKYVAFLHYDDLWDPEKLKKQVDFMESKSLSGSYSSVMIMNEKNEYNPHDYSFPFLNRETVGKRTCAFAHSCIINKEHLFNSGILETEDKWGENYYDKFSIGFEDIWAVFVHKLKNVEKAEGARMYWRNHAMSVSSTFNAGNELVTEQRNATQYHRNDMEMDDWGSEFRKIIENIKTTY